jgi:DNA-binding protein H-NS
MFARVQPRFALRIVVRHSAATATNERKGAMAPLQNLHAKIEKLKAQAEAVVRKESDAVIAKICDIMVRHVLTPADIDAHIGLAKKGASKPSMKVGAKSSPVAKFRNPKTGATWSGRGKAPAWFAGGKDQAKLLIC